MLFRPRERADTHHKCLPISSERGARLLALAVAGGLSGCFRLFGHLFDVLRVNSVIRVFQVCW